jgi:thiol-disulfide isomerase/thioredoxin
MESRGSTGVRAFSLRFLGDDMVHAPPPLGNLPNFRAWMVGSGRALDGAPAVPRPSGPGMTVKVYGADWCGDCRRTKRQLEDLGVAFEGSSTFEH